MVKNLIRLLSTFESLLIESLEQVSPLLAIGGDANRGKASKHYQPKPAENLKAQGHGPVT
jgi:hypothetical protein